MKIDETYRNRLAMYLNSFDNDIDRDLLEIDLYDEEYEKECCERFKKNAIEYVKSNNLDYRFDSDCYHLYFRIMTDKYGSIENCPEDIKNELYAYKKYILYYMISFEVDKTIHFGKKIGRSNDRYDYFMYLRNGLSYQPKYITKEELIKILKEDKYGYSSHCIF